MVFSTGFQDPIREKMTPAEAAHLQEIAERLRDLAKMLHTAVPPEGRGDVLIPIVDGLHLLCRRNRDGTVSRFFHARLTVNGKLRETELGSTTTNSIDDAWQRLVRFRREAAA
jgi:hypothetical protein